ncbi:MAG: electron transport complex subunit RsxD [Oceanococcus sp.]
MLRSSPHLPVAARVNRVMLQVCLALLPGIAAYLWFFGWGVFSNLLIACLTAIGSEALMLLARKRPLKKFLFDGSALVTGLLLGLSIPPYAPWWLIVFGVSFAIVFGKHLYGGLGYNPFNPAMLGFVVLLIAFPAEMSTWIDPTADLDQHRLSAYSSGRIGLEQLDGMTSATPLDHVKTELSRQLTTEEAHASLNTGFIAGYAWDWINLAFLLGGLWMLKRRLIRWQIPLGMLAGLGLMTLLFWLGDADRHPGLLHHWFGGATMLGAFFIATDPVSASTTPRGRLYYGFGIGVLVYLIRSLGGYPDGVAFAVLLMNICVPLIDHYTPTRTYGTGPREP